MKTTKVSVKLSPRKGLNVTTVVKMFTKDTFGDVTSARRKLSGSVGSDSSLEICGHSVTRQSSNCARDWAVVDGFSGLSNRPWLFLPCLGSDFACSFRIAYNHQLKA